MAHTIRSSGGAGENGRTSPGTARAAAAAPSASPGNSAPAAGDARPVEHARHEHARHIVGRLAALPRLARSADAATESVAERMARRRRAAQATLDVESGAAATDWARVGVFGAGMAVGALIGAGVALLLAPATGYETRTRLARRARQTGGRAADRWEDVSDDLRDKARHGARRVKRAATTSRWAVEDAWERQHRD